MGAVRCRGGDLVNARARARLGAALIVGLTPRTGLAGESVVDLERWGLSVEPEPGAIECIEAFAEDGGDLPEGYAARLATSLHGRVFAETAARIRTPVPEDPVIDVSFPGGGLARNAEDGGDLEIVRDFEGGFVRAEVFARLPASVTPRQALETLADPKFRRSASSRIEVIEEKDGLLCIETRGKRPFVRAMRSCTRDLVWHAGGISALLSRTVATTDAGGRQPVYFKESLKTVVATPDGLVFHSIHYSRTRGFGALTRRIARGKIEEAQRRALDALRERLTEVLATAEGGPGY
jgi:hypothetical protein